jgi:hypothetical protein
LAAVSAKALCAYIGCGVAAPLNTDYDYLINQC